MRPTTLGYPEVGVPPVMAIDEERVRSGESAHPTARTALTRAR
jgi:hypothetical protein